VFPGRYPGETSGRGAGTARRRGRAARVSDGSGAVRMAVPLSGRGAIAGRKRGGVREAPERRRRSSEVMLLRECCASGALRGGDD
jgi:hypothetical protein